MSDQQMSVLLEIILEGKWREGKEGWGEELLEQSGLYQLAMILVYS